MAIKAWKSMHICDSMEESPCIARIELMHLLHMYLYNSTLRKIWFV